MDPLLSDGIPSFELIERFCEDGSGTVLDSASNGDDVGMLQQQICQYVAERICQFAGRQEDNIGVLRHHQQ